MDRGVCIKKTTYRGPDYMFGVDQKFTSPKQLFVGCHQSKVEV